MLSSLCQALKQGRTNASERTRLRGQWVRSPRSWFDSPLNRCRLLGPITGVAPVWRQGPRPEPLDYSSPHAVSQAWYDNCNQKRVARTALVLVLVLRSG